MDKFGHIAKKHGNKNTKRLSGKAKGLIRMKDDFDEPIKGFNDHLK